MKTVMTKFILAGMVLLPLLGFGSDNQKNAEKSKKGTQLVDSGIFSIYISGKRVGTETFHVEQGPEYSTVKAEIRVEEGNGRADQSAEMQIMPNGNLRAYTWRATFPQKEEVSVEPKDQLLVEHVIPADQKKLDFPHILPQSTVILDDNFFSHREILVWRYLATGCIPKDKDLMCGASHFGILVPHQHTAGSVEVQLIGPDKITVKGAPRDVNKIRIDSDGIIWYLWVTEPEDHYKVLKMAIPSNNVEVVRE